MTKYNPMLVQQDIAELLRLHPELAEDEVLRADCIEAQTGAHELLTMLVRSIGSAVAVERGLDSYIAELKERKGRFERRQQGLRQLIFKVMNTADLRKMELPEATLSVRNGQQKVIVVEESQIPEEFMRVIKEPKKNEIKAAMKAGEHVPGCILSNAEPVLAIITR